MSDIRQIWYDRILLFRNNQKVDLCLVSPNDFKEVVAEWRYNYPYQPSGDFNTVIYANCAFMRSEAIQDGKPEIYTKCE